MPVLSQVAEYMPLVGSDSMTLAELSGGLQKLGASYYFSADKNNFNIYISGLDANIDTIMALVTDLLYNPASEDKKIDNLLENAKATEKMERDDPETTGSALYQFAVYGDRSHYINRLTVNDVKELKADSLISALQKTMRYEADIHYSGKIPLKDLEEVLKSRLALKNISIKSKSPVRNDFKEYDGPVVFFLNDKEAIQSKDYFFLPGEILKEEDKPYLNAYADYLDGGMYSIIFQEIRELRSFAYSSGAYIQRPFYRDEKTSLTAYVGTQADKTEEAIEVMYRILTTPPDKSDRIDLVRKALIQSVNSDKPGFRSISYPASNFNKQGYTVDPRQHWVDVYKEMNFDNIVETYNQQYFQKPSVITIIGDESRIGTDWMSAYGKVVKVDKEDIFRW
jgi:predicted Zn-dependent peptidase